VLVTTIPALEAQAGMIDYTFLLLVKNDLYKPHFSPSLASTGKTSGLITSGRNKLITQSPPKDIRFIKS
jgi:hypothetical protein